MPQGTELLVVEREVHVAASPQTVFEFFTDPDKMTRWMGSVVELEPEPGGDLRIDLNGRWVASGEFVEVTPPSRVVFTWGWEEGMAVAPGSSTVEITLQPDGAGTLVRLTHRDLPSDEECASHDHGWAGYLDRLAIATAGGDPGPDLVAEQAT
ncbi:MAG TPA: SRPBCC domain-containing protein [Thermoleophilaceae bacterium]|nr:SRPBCC domain-containing protein [Thermoleophilaceae bacterium]